MINKDFTILRGPRQIIRFSFVRPQSVVGWTTLFVMRTSPDAPDITFQAAGAVADGGSTGVFEVDLSHAVTVALDPGKYAYSFSRTDVGAEDLLRKGTVTVEPDVLNEVTA